MGAAVSFSQVSGVIGSPLEIQGTAPEIRRVETDQTDPAGRFRDVVTGDGWFFEEKTAAGGTWTTSQWLEIGGDRALDTIYTYTNPTSSQVLWSSFATYNRTSNGAQRVYAIQGVGGIPTTNTANATATTPAGLVAVNGHIQSGSSGSGTFSRVAAFAATWSLGAGPTVTNAYGLYVDGLGGSPDLTNFYGIYIENPGSTATTLQYGLYIEEPTGATTNRPLFVAGGTSEFDGAIQADGDLDVNSLIDQDPPATSGTPATTGAWLDQGAAIFTDNNTAASGTAAAMVFTALQQPTLAATNTGVTTTDAATLYIANAPAAGTNQTITNAWALWVDAGAVRFDGNLQMGTSLLIKEGDTNTFWLRNAADNAYRSLKLRNLDVDNVLNLLNDRTIAAANADGNTFKIQTKDSGVGLVTVTEFVGAADPYVQIGRDDTGVATGAVTDMLRLQAGAGTNNEAANFGLGVTVYLGNAASQVEERASIDWVLVTATDGSEDTRVNFNLMAGGAENLACYIDQNGELYADADGSSGTYLTNGVNLFDDYDDPVELQRFAYTAPGVPFITEEERQANRRRMVELGIWEEKDTGSGYMMKLQPMMRLLAGGIYQTRHRLDSYCAALEAKIAALEGRLTQLQGQVQGELSG